MGKWQHLVLSLDAGALEAAAIHDGRGLPVKSEAFFARLDRLQVESGQVIDMALSSTSTSSFQDSRDQGEAMPMKFIAASAEGTSMQDTLK